MHTVTMTVFITHCLKKTRIDLRGLLFGLWFACVGVVSAQTLAPEVSSLRLERVDDAIFLSARLKFELPDAVEDALLKGVAMFFVAEVEVLRERWYWTAKKVVSVQRHMRLAYQPLTRRWRLNVASGMITGAGLAMALNQNFDSLPEALAAMQRLSRWKIVEVAAIEPSQDYQLAFSFRLDASQLPRPLQIGAFGQSDWVLSISAGQPLAWESEK